MWLFLLITISPPLAMGLWLIFRLVLLLRSTRRQENRDSSEIGASKPA
jgi:hypothetical protein